MNLKSHDFLERRYSVDIFLRVMDLSLVILWVDHNQVMYPVVRRVEKRRTFDEMDQQQSL